MVLEKRIDIPRVVVAGCESSLPPSGEGDAASIGLNDGLPWMFTI
jgi:hypothetical protein